MLIHLYQAKSDVSVLCFSYANYFYDAAILESLIPEAETLTKEQIQSVLLAAFHTTAAVEALKKVRDSAATDNSLV